MILYFLINLTNNKEWVMSALKIVLLPLLYRLMSKMLTLYDNDNDCDFQSFFISFKYKKCMKELLIVNFSGF